MYYLNYQIGYMNNKSSQALGAQITLNSFNFNAVHFYCLNSRQHAL